MTLLQAIILGIVQGITEFFPISSSGHLVIIEKIMSLDVSELRSFDVAVHFGSLSAIVLYFRNDFIKLFKSFILFLSGKANFKKILNSEIFYLVVGTIPAVVVGLLLNPIFDEHLRSEYLVGIFMIITGIYFLLAEKFKIKEGELTWIKAIKIGIAQAFAILPGVSRSGSTIATGIMIGINRQEAARFSFLLGSIAILGATILTGKDVVSKGLDVDVSILVVGVLVSLISSFLSVHFLMKLLKTSNLFWFAIYLFVVGSAVLLLNLSFF